MGGQRFMPDRDFFYVRPQDVGGERLFLRADEAHHLSRVHRKAVGETFFAVNGEGLTFECLVEELGRDGLTAQIVKTHRRWGEPQFRLTLAVALTKKRGFEWVVEKGTEVGVASFLPVVSARSVVRPGEHKVGRWERIALAAMKQCGRSCLPSVASVRSIDEFFGDRGDYDVKLVAHEKQSGRDLDEALRDVRTPRSGLLLVGPEGGFTEDEVNRAERSGFFSLGLGPRRLRTETAALVGAALILNAMGEFS